MSWLEPYWASSNGETTVTLYQADVLDALRRLPADSVQCVVTSPPYYGLRDYGVEGQIGLETTPEEYVDKLVEVFREVRRVLRPDGVLWLNLGDSYNGSGGAGGDYGPGGLKEGQPKYPGRKVPGLKPKDLVGVPWRVAFALQADGWYLRSDIIWHKPNPMPESVADRPTRSHEYVFLLSKQERYFYDTQAIAEPSMSDPTFRNRRDVWTVNTQPYPNAHFATFPERLPELCILAGTSQKACPICGAPWERVTERNGSTWEVRRAAGAPGKYGFTTRGTPLNRMGNLMTRTIDWQPTCSCEGNDGGGKSVVLDPFAGSGTTLFVAQRLGRNSIGIELNLEYCEIAKRRISAEHSQLKLRLEVDAQCG